MCQEKMTEKVLVPKGLQSADANTVHISVSDSQYTSILQNLPGQFEKKITNKIIKLTYFT